MKTALFEAPAEQQSTLPESQSRLKALFRRLGIATKAFVAKPPHVQRESFRPPNEVWSRQGHPDWVVHKPLHAGSVVPAEVGAVLTAHGWKGSESLGAGDGSWRATPDNTMRGIVGPGHTPESGVVGVQHRERAMHGVDVASGTIR